MNQDQIENALDVLVQLGMPSKQHNERTALCLLALLQLEPHMSWDKAYNPLLGITPIMEWVKRVYGKSYAPNTRETFRKDSVQQFVEAGLVLQNPDDSLRSVNSPKNVYQIEPTAYQLLKSYGTYSWKDELERFRLNNRSLIERYAKERRSNNINVMIAKEHVIEFSPGEHSTLIKRIVEDFRQIFVPESEIVYVGDTGKKWAHYDEELLSRLGVRVDPHGKMPDVVLYCPVRRWLVILEAVTSHGPVNSKRHDELKRLFSNSLAGIVFVTAFHSRAMLGRYVGEISWETEVWVADNPTHLIHFNGSRFLGPY